MTPVYTFYKNRYGKNLILDEGLLGSFKDMQAGLSVSGIDIEMTDAFRGQEAQNDDKAKGNSNAAWGSSPHNYGVAFDCAPIVNGTLCWPPKSDPIWQTISEVGKGLGLTWGGDFHSICDLPHFELTGWAKMGLKLGNTDGTPSSSTT